MTFKERSIGSPLHLSPKSEAPKGGQDDKDTGNLIVLSVNEDDNDTVVELQLKKSVFFSQAEIDNHGGNKVDKAIVKTGSSGRVVAAGGGRTHDEEDESIGIEEGSEV